MGNLQKRILIQKISHLPTLPNVLTKIIELTESRQANAKQLGEILSRDPSISSMILKLVNSAFYGKLRHISSIHHATVILGFQMVKTIAMGVSIFQEDGKEGPFDRKQFWIHSIGVAYIARVLRRLVAHEEELELDTVFLSGLLHDVGKVVFDNYFTDEYAKVATLIKEEDLWIREAERRILGIDHCDAGFYLGRKWQFPTMVVDAIRYHHNPDQAPPETRFLCTLVHAGDHGCRRLELGSGGDATIPPLHPIAREFGITENILTRAIDEVAKERDNLENFLTDRV
jgi:putative nucleotidyltransferase with HDIG domain